MGSTRVDVKRSFGKPNAFAPMAVPSAGEFVTAGGSDLGDTVACRVAGGNGAELLGLGDGVVSLEGAVWFWE